MPFLSALLIVSFLFWLFRPTTSVLRSYALLGTCLSAAALALSLSGAKGPATVVTILASAYAIGYGVFAFRSTAGLQR
jgi:hypothetical protein